MFHCTRCCWMSAPSGCSNRQRSQRERVEQWIFWDLFLCFRSGRYTYHQTGDGVIAPRKSQWNKCFPCFPTSWIAVNRRYLLLWQPALRELLLYCHDTALSEEFIPWIESWANVSRFCGTDVDTIVLAANVRLSCMLPALWISGQTLQGTWMSLMSRGCRSSFQQGEFGILPAFHGDDIPYYFPQYVLESLGCFNLSKPSKRNRRPNCTFQQ